MPLVLDENGPLFMTLTSPVLTNQTACHAALGRRNKGPLGRDSAAKDQGAGWVLCAQLTGISATIAYYEHEQQRRGDGRKEHPAYGCSNHRRVHILAGFGCNTSQSHVAARSGSETSRLVIASIASISRHRKNCVWSPPSGLHSQLHFRLLASEILNWAFRVNNN